jgi:hypothetical protein
MAAEAAKASAKARCEERLIAADMVVLGRSTVLPKEWISIVLPSVEPAKHRHRHLLEAYNSQMFWRLNCSYMKYTGK